MKRLWRLLVLLILFSGAVILTVFSQRASEYAREALKVCAVSVIPSLFPYMVISHMTVNSSAAGLFGRYLPLSRLYSLPDCASAPIILGALCGFPVGVTCSVRLYENGSITKEQCEALISCAGNVGPSFIVSVIGASFFGSSAFGWLLYVFQLLSSFAASLFINRLVFPLKKVDAKSAPPPPFKACSFSAAVADSCSSVTRVCGFIVFFSVIFAFTVPFIETVSEMGAALLASILEFSSGARYSAGLGGARGRFFCGLSVGFSGLCVFSQTASFTAGASLSLKRTFAVKILQGLLCGAFSAFIPPLFKVMQAGCSLPPVYDRVSLLISAPFLPAIISAILYFFALKSIMSE